MKKSRIKFIKELHEESDEAWKEAIEKEFPKIFKEEGFKVGDWVFVESAQSGAYCANGKIGRVLPEHTTVKNGLDTGLIITYGESNCGIGEKAYVRKATAEETKKALIKEAERRGFKAGVYYKPLHKELPNYDCYGKPQRYDYHPCYNKESQTLEVGVGYIFQNGEWAEIIPTMTKEEAEEKLNVKIIQ